MSELKDYDIMDIEYMDDERLKKSESGKIQVTRVYIKSEADKVIAEKDKEIYNIKYSRDEWAKTCNQKDKEITELKEHNANYRFDSNNMLHKIMKQDAELRHQKYKRCLAMARWCYASSEIERTFDVDKYAKWYMKWYYRWAKIADKFKEEK